MRKYLALVIAAAAATAFQTTRDPEAARWAKEAERVTIIRDTWGIAHVFGQTDADAVFGAIYAQAEDDFPRVELNFINGLGRLAEAEGESRIFQDLRMKLFVDPAALKAQLAASPASLQTLMTAWADGLNYYLATHPAVKPRVITRFEPWMALSFTEGSIGGDISRVNLNNLQAFYGKGLGLPPAADEPPPVEPGGSNGAAVAAKNATSRHALLLINPHTSFFFRSEFGMASAEGLNAYGAATWGQFFLYQGFNEHIGWMHTTSAADDTDEYLEAVTKRGDHYVYQYGSEEKPVLETTITVPYRMADGGTASRAFTVYRTHHGPVIREQNGKWVAYALMNEPVKALTQSWTRTKATDYASFRQTMELHTNSSNNTIFADDRGDIAYFHGNFIPRRDPAFDWARPVDGFNPATDWHGLLSVDDTPHLFNPESGWLYNSNDSPWAAAGPSSPKRTDFPAYVDNGNESARGRHAVRVLQNRTDFTLDGLLAAAYDSYLTYFEKPVPALSRAWDALPEGNPLKLKLAEPIASLRTWDLRWSATSVPTSLAVFWATEAQRRGRGRGAPAINTAETPSAAEVPATGRGGTPLESMAVDQLLQAFAAACDALTADFGTWKTPWGAINRFQRLTGDITSRFDDAQPSTPVMFTAGTWGSLASFAARAYTNTKKWYGASGNSFVAVVEFGPRVKARAVSAGGESGDPKSPHFNDQAERYATGNLREVYFYRDQLAGHIEREYHPGK